MVFAGAVPAEQGQVLRWVPCREIMARPSACRFPSTTESPSGTTSSTGSLCCTPGRSPSEPIGQDMRNDVSSAVTRSRSSRPSSPTQGQPAARAPSTERGLAGRIDGEAAEVAPVRRRDLVAVAVDGVERGGSAEPMAAMCISSSGAATTRSCSTEIAVWSDPTVSAAVRPADGVRGHRRHGVTEGSDPRQLGVLVRGQPGRAQGHQEVGAIRDGAECCDQPIPRAWTRVSEPHWGPGTRRPSTGRSSEF